MAITPSGVELEPRSLTSLISRSGLEGGDSCDLVGRILSLGSGLAQGTFPSTRKLSLLSGFTGGDSTSLRMRKGLEGGASFGSKSLSPELEKPDAPSSDTS